MPFARRNAFTLIELMMIMTIILALVAFGVAGILGAKQRAAVARAKSELALLAQALEDYKRHYGDYPQTGGAQQASPTATSDINAAQAQALLFNALLGVYSPTDFSTQRNGPTFVELSKFNLEQTADYKTKSNANTLGVPSGTPPVKTRVATSFLDPWGNRYLYYYKNPRNPAAWGNGQPYAYVLYSAGPDGKVGTATTGTGATDNGLNVTSGFYSTTTAQTSGFNADNLYADKLP